MYFNRVLNHIGNGKCICRKIETLNNFQIEFLKAVFLTVIML